MFFSKQTKYETLQRKINRYKKIGKNSDALQAELEALKATKYDKEIEKKKKKD